MATQIITVFKVYFKINILHLLGDEMIRDENIHVF